MKELWRIFRYEKRGKTPDDSSDSYTDNSVPVLIYNPPIEKTLCQNCHIQHSLCDYWQSLCTEIGPIMLLQTNRPAPYLAELRHVHYHLLLSTESTKKLMRRREGSCQIFHFIFPIFSLPLQYSSFELLCQPKCWTDTYNANYTLQATIHLHKWSIVTL